MEGDKAAAAAIDEGEGDGAGKEAPLGVKLRRAISANRRGGLCTPVPSWKLEEPGLSDPDKAQPHRRSVSARKLGAGLWEIQDVLTMSAAGRRGARIRRHRRDGKALEDGIGPSHILGHEDLVSFEFFRFWLADFFALYSCNYFVSPGSNLSLLSFHMTYDFSCARCNFLINLPSWNEVFHCCFDCRRFSCGCPLAAFVKVYYLDFWLMTIWYSGNVC